MKLILKRVPHFIEPIHIGDSSHLKRGPEKCKERPFALYTAAGEILPRQQSVVTESLPGKCPTVTVTFFLDGDDVKVQGDD